MAKKDKSKQELPDEIEKLRKRLDRAKADPPAARKKRPRKQAPSRPPADDVLRESVERYRSLVELSPDAIAVHCEGKFEYVNQTGARLFGAADAGELTGRRVLDLVHPDYREIVRDRVRQTYEQRKQTPLRELRILRLDGQAVDVEATAAPITYRCKPAAQVVIRDITERKRTEQALRESEERFRLSQDTAGVGTFDWNIHTGVNTWTPKLEAMYGLPPGGFARTQQAWENLVHPEDRAGAVRLVEQAFETGALTEGEWRVVWPDGSIHWLAGRWQVFKDESGKPARMTGVNIDITERKRAEERINRLASFPQLNPNPVMEVDPSGKVSFYNPATAKILEALKIDKENVTIFLPADLDGILRDWDKKSEANLYREVTVKDRVFSETVHLSPQFSVARIYAYDITGRKRAEEALQQAKDELEVRIHERTAELRLTIDSLREEIEEREKAERQLKETKKKLQSILESISDGFFTLDRDWRYTYVNNEALRQFNRSREDMIGKRIWDVSPKAKGTIFEKQYIKALAEKVPVVFDAFSPLMERWVEVRAYPSEEGLSIYFHDITERRETEERIRVTNDLLRLFAEKTSRREYLDATVGLIRSWSGCRHAGIRIVDREGNIPYESCVGYSAGFLETERTLSLDRDVCACTRVVLGAPEPQDLPAMTPNGSFYSNNTMKFMEGLTDGQKGRFRGVCVRSGFTSVAVVPIRYRDRVLGAFHLADEREGMVPLGSVEFIEQLAFIIGETIFRFGIEDDLRKNYDDLQKASELLERIFSTTHMLVAYMDREFNFIRVNRAYAEADGRDPDFYVGKNHFLLFPDDENEAIFRKVVDTGEPFFVFEKAFEYTEHPERGVTYWDWSLVPVKESDGRISGVVLSLINVTDRKRTQEELSLFKNLLNQSNEAVFLIDPETSRILEFNDAACTSLGYSREELLAMKVIDFAEFQRNYSRWNESVAQVRAKGYVLLEDRLRRKDGTMFPVEVGIRHIVHGNREYHVAVVRDTTERKLAEAERARLASAVESTADAVVITDASGFIQYVNPAFERVTGYSRNEALGRDLHILDSGKHDAAFYERLREALARDGVWRGVMVNRKKGGMLYHEDCTYSIVKSAAGDVVNYVSIKRDITEKLKLEAVAESVNTMNNIGYVFSGVRHEIGNPINSAKMILSVLQHKLDKIDKDDARDYVDRALNEIGRVEHLLRGLKNFNMFETPELENVDLGPFLTKFLDLVTEDFGKKGIVISLAVDSGADRVKADPRALQQVLLNIVTNAADALAGRENPCITISVLKKFEQILIRVADNGCGMTDEQQRDLFKPFYTSKSRGTGLGLVIVKKVLAKMNGDIEIASRPDRGTTVNIYLPEGRNASAREKDAPDH
jgi:PAS domain S-box-containing protein